MIDIFEIEKFTEGFCKRLSKYKNRPMVRLLKYEKPVIAYYVLDWCGLMYSDVSIKECMNALELVYANLKKKYGVE